MTVFEGEEFRELDRLPGYKITRDGRIFGKYGKWLKLNRGTGGYLTVGPCVNGVQKTERVNRLVAEAWLPPPTLGQTDVAHKDDVKTNNNAANLRWSTHADNMADAIRNGCFPKAKTHCPAGHEYTDENTGHTGRRYYCKACKRARGRKSQ